MADTISVWPKVGTTYLDAADVEITSAGAIVPVSAYITDAIRRGDLLTYDPLEVYAPVDHTGTTPGAYAPTNAEYLVSTANPGLTNERVLTAGTGITLTPGAGTLTVSSTAGGAPSNAGYIVTALDGTLTQERRLVGGAGIGIVDGGPGGDLTISASGGGGGAPTDAQYVLGAANGSLANGLVLTAGTGISIGSGFGQILVGNALYSGSFVTMSAQASMPNERVLTAGTGISIADGGPGGAVTISSTGGAGGAPDSASYVTLGTNGTLTNERVLTAGTGISLVDGGAGGNVTINNTGAPVDAEYLVGSANGTLSNERVLTAGTGITLTPGAGTLTVAATAGGAPSTASYVTLATDATLSNERVLTAGSGISIVDGGAGSTITISASGGGGSGPTGFLSVLDAGVVQGVLANNTARQTNRANFNTAISNAVAQNKILLVPPGRYEIHGGPLNINSDRFRWLGSPNAEIWQYQLNTAVMHVGPALGAAGVISGAFFDGAWLKFAGTASAGGHALEVTGGYMCWFQNFLIGDPYNGATGSTSTPFIGVYIDPAAGTTPTFSCNFRNFWIKNFAAYGWHQFRDSYDAATGNVYENIYISSGGAGDVRDITGNNGIPAYFGSLAQSVFNQLNIEWSIAKTALHLEVCRACTFNSVNIEGVTLKNTSALDSGMISLYQSQAVFNGCMINNCTFNSANNITNPSFFRVQDNSWATLSAFHPLLMQKTGISNLALVRNWDGAGNAGCGCNLISATLGDSDQLDLIDGLTFSSGNDGLGFGALGDFRNDTPLTLANANVTHYTYRTPGVLSMTPATSAKTVTLARQCSAANATRIPRGVRRVVRRVGATQNLVVANYNAATLATLGTADQSAEFVFNGTDWVYVGKGATGT